MADMVPAWVEGKLTPMDKLEVHQRGLRHKAVSVFVLAGDEVLIQQRAAGKYHTPGLWANTCCTHPLWGEPAEVCAVRRLEQELGITGVTPVWRRQAEYRADVGGGLVEHEVVEIFTVDAPRDLIVRPNPDEVQAVRWMTRAALEAEIAESPEAHTPWMRIYMADHAAAIFGPDTPA
ncbi:isopentenyl-diphosphate delta-isomerase [Marinovum sp.]|uniref:isopentenyl-diphosphate delta-isomerase n=1 Tax=Marinovum sp. TaxID=2024839 RepID=UPI003A9136FF